MAKKKLTPYEEAQRQFVRARLQETGKEKSPETRQQFRQRFDTLAAEKEGRTRLAQKLLPGEGAEERRNFKRMLATDLPARTGTGGTGTGGTGTGGTGTGGTGAVSTSWQEALRGGIPATQKTTTTTTSQTTTVAGKILESLSTQSPTKGPNAFQNRRNNIIGQGINYPGRNFFDSLANPAGGSGRITDWSAKGLAKVAGQEAKDALAVLPVLGTAFGVAKGAQLSYRYGGRFVATPILKGLAKVLNVGPAKGINKLGGVGKTVYGPGRPPAQFALGPGSTTATSTARSVTAQRTARLNKKGGVGGQPYGPQRPYGPYLPPAATTKAATTKAATTKASTTKAPLKTKDEIVVTKAQGKFPGATDKDAVFLQKLTRAQQAIEKQSEGYQNYAKWLRNDQTQATIARLKRKK
jgi:hypothetical protein